MDTPKPSFSAGRIAAWLKINKRTVWSHLAGYPETEERFVSGNLTKHWTMDALPELLQKRLRGLASEHGFRNAEQMLSQEPTFFKPAVPLSNCDAGVIAKARLLQQAQARALERRNDLGLSRAEWEQMAVEDYQRMIGPVSPRHCMDLLYRTIERAGQAAEYWRLELYLDERPAKKAKVISGKTVFDFEPIALELQRCGNPPSAKEIDHLWAQAVKLFREQSAEANSKRLKRRLLGYLLTHVPDMAASYEALRRNFDRKLALTLELQGDEVTALADGRRERRGVANAKPIPSEDIETMVGYTAFNCGFRVAQGIREMAAMGERSGLTAETLEILNRQSASKSYVNARIYSPVVRGVCEIMPFILGKKAIDDATASHRRTYGRLRSMTVITADDFTMPVYFWIQDRDGRYRLTRGQCLLYIDCRSLNILGFSLQPERNYNSLVIRTLDNRVCQQWGIPKYKYYERGIWQNSKVVKNAAPVGWSAAHSDAESDFGWGQLGVRIIHAKRARSKLAELVGGLLQNLMERVIGYCGRDERRDCPEITKKNKLAVESGRVHPEGLFLSFDQWQVELQRLIEWYNATTQQGFILDGLSPDKAFEQFWPKDDPPTPYNGAHAHLNAHWVSKRTVTVNGICFKIGKEPYVYRAEELRFGDTLLAWFDPDCADSLGVTDLKQRNPMVVERMKDVDFLAAIDPESAEGQVFQMETAKAQTIISNQRARFKVLQKKFEPTFRRMIVPPDVAKVGETFAAGRKSIEDRKTEQNSRAGSIGRKAKSLNLAHGACRNDEETLEALDLMASARKEQAEQEKKEDI